MACGMFFGVMLGLAVVPILIAQLRNHRNAGAIAVCAIIGIFVFPFWLVAMVWSFTDNTHNSGATP